MTIFRPRVYSLFAQRIKATDSSSWTAYLRCKIFLKKNKEMAAPTEISLIPALILKKLVLRFLTAAKKQRKTAAKKVMKNEIYVTACQCQAQKGKSINTRVLGE